MAWAELTVQYLGSATSVAVEYRPGLLGGGSTDAVLRVMRVSDEHAEQCRLTDEDGTDARPAVFIGQGRSPGWRELKDHLGDKHGYRVVAYESGARLGTRSGTRWKRAQRKLVRGARVHPRRTKQRTADLAPVRTSCTRRDCSRAGWVSTAP